MRNRVAAIAVALAPVLTAFETAIAFPPPVTDSPIGNYTAEIDTNYNSVESFSEPLGLNPNTFATEPDLYWFKYVSNGQTEVTFDTLGSDFGTEGPGGGTGGGGGVLGSYNQSEIAVYNSTGSLVALSKSTVDNNGNPIPVYPTYSSDSSQWYESEGLSQLHFEPNAPTDPHWNVSPTDPNPYTGWAAPGNSGNSQKYYPPYYDTSLNEYQVWNTALSTVVLDDNGNPVINPDTGQPYAQPGWRYYDRARVGPGSSWNQYDVLPAGTYYIAVASVNPVLSGDTPTEQVLEAPISYDPSTGQNDVPQLTSDLGTWQYYEDPSDQLYWGTIELNVTQTPLPTQLDWNNAAGTGDGQSWDSSSQNWNDGGSAMYSDGSDVIFNDTNNGHYAVVLNSSLSPNSVYVDNSLGNYTISGSGSITGSAHLDKNGSGTLTLSTVNSYTGGTAVDGGTLIEGVNGALPTNQALEIHNAAVVQLATDTGATILSSLYISSGATLDITNNHVLINYGSSYDPISTIVSYLTLGYNGGSWNGEGINTSAATGTKFGVGYADSADPGNPAGLASDQIEIAYTLYGDTNLDGAVNSIDFGNLAANFGKSGKIWGLGDFNYDGTVNSLDFGLLAGNFGKSVGSAADVAGSADWAALDAFAAANGLLAEVPEPGAFALFLVGAAAMLTRRQRVNSV
jgi:autotransporter-associated beta strand protein